MKYLIKSLTMLLALLTLVSSPAATAGMLSFPLTVGQAVPIADDVTLTLNKVTPADKEALGGSAYTEYNLTITNNTDLEFVILKIAAVVYDRGTEFMVRNVDEIVQQDDPGNPRKEDPAKWHDDLEKQGFLGMSDGISVMPKKTLTNSVWFKQAKGETVRRIQLYLFDSVKRGRGNLVKLELSK